MKLFKTIAYYCSFLDIYNGTQQGSKNSFWSIFQSKGYGELIAQTATSILALLKQGVGTCKNPP